MLREYVVKLMYWNIEIYNQERKRDRQWKKYTIKKEREKDNERINACIL